VRAEGSQRNADGAEQRAQGKEDTVHGRLHRQIEARQPAYRHDLEGQLGPRFMTWQVKSVTGDGNGPPSVPRRAGAG